MEKFNSLDLVIADPKSAINIEEYLGKYKDCPFFITKCVNNIVYIDEVYIEARVPAEALMLVKDYVFNKYGFRRKDIVYIRGTLEEVEIIEFEEYYIDPEDGFTGISIVHEDKSKEYMNKITHIDEFMTKDEYRSLTICEILSDD